MFQKNWHFPSIFHSQFAESVDFKNDTVILAPANDGIDMPSQNPMASPHFFGFGAKLLQGQRSFLPRGKGFVFHQKSTTSRPRLNNLVEADLEVFQQQTLKNHMLFHVFSRMQFESQPCLKKKVDLFVWVSAAPANVAQRYGGLQHSIWSHINQPSGMPFLTNGCLFLRKVFFMIFCSFYCFHWDLGHVMGQLQNVRSLPNLRFATPAPFIDWQRTRVDGLRHGALQKSKRLQFLVQGDLWAICFWVARSSDDFGGLFSGLRVFSWCFFVVDLNRCFDWLH